MSIESIQTIGERLKKIRQQKGMTQAELAKKADTDKNYYAIIERGEAKNITLNKFEKIVKALGIKSSDILPF